jgi:hypothetical protein
MAITGYAQRDTEIWLRSPWAYQLGEDFKTTGDMLRAIIGDGDDVPEGPVKKSIQTFKDQINEFTPTKYLRPNQSDTSLGGNDAINCFPGFCRNDDVIHPLTGICGNTDRGLGRVYHEVYDKHQQLLHLTFGVPEFGDLKSFYGGLFNKNLADLVHKGETSTSEALGGLLGTVAGGVGVLSLAVRFPILPLVYLLKKTSESVDVHRVTKYYDFKSAMPLFYRYCNSILSHLAVNMGLYPNGTGGDSNGQFNMAYNELYADEADPDAIPEILRDGLDMYKILAKRDKFLRADGSDETFLDISSEGYLMGKKNGEDSGFFSTFVARTSATAHGADKFVSYRIDKNVDSTESVNNQSGESSIHQLLNSKAASGKDMMFSLMHGKLVDIPGVGDVVSALTKFASNALSTVTLGASQTIEGILTGSGMADIPEVWTGSSFSKSYNFHMSFRSHSGDPVSILQNIYCPMIPWLVAALPRSVGENSYTAPFLVRAYSTGLFAIPCGMVESMTIRRGGAEFGWSSSMLPTVVEIDVTIKDLSPVMHMALMDKNSDLFKIFAQNSTFQEYLLTLSGMGLNERLLTIPRVMRKLKTSLRTLRTTYANPLFWATSIGSSTIPRVVGAISPYSRYGQ